MRENSRRDNLLYGSSTDFKRSILITSTCASQEATAREKQSRTIKQAVHEEQNWHS